MPTTKNPRRGSLQFWPRKRAKRMYPRVKNFTGAQDAGLLGFAGYKVGMTHIIMTDNSAKGRTKGEDISCPVTIVECPPLRVAAVRLYKDDVYGRKTVTEVTNPKFERELARKLSVPKKANKKLDDIKLDEGDEVRLVVYTQPKRTTIGKKKPEVFEIALGGSKEDQLAFAKENFDKEIPASTFFNEGTQYDAHSVTKGKGFQGAVKRFGVMIKGHKSEKKKRAPGNLGPWHPAKISFRVPQPGQMGCHTRTEYNKIVLKSSTNPSEINSASGFRGYGLVKNDYILVKGSLGGSAKRLVRFTKATRPDPLAPKEAPAIQHISCAKEEATQ